MVIGVLALQGAVSEHQRMLQQCGVDSILVKHQSDLTGIDGLIIPGGESTAIRKLLVREDMLENLKELVNDGLPILGTCAGLILLVQSESLAGLDAKVVRNGFGRQKNSFEEPLELKGIDHDFNGIFIRAPYISEVGPEVEVLAKTDDGRIVAVREKNVLATAFHPELTDDSSVHELFVKSIVG